MNRRTAALAVLMVAAGAILGCGRHRSALPPTADEAIRLDVLVEQLHREGKFQEAIPLAEQSLVLREKAQGVIHPDVATSLDNLASLHDAQGAYAKAEPLYLRALAIRKHTLGVTHPQVATTLHSLGTLYEVQGAHAKAEPLFVQALAIRERVLGAMHPFVAASLSSLAELYEAQASYAKAEPLYLRALHIYENALGAMHPRVASCLDKLATLYCAQGAYAKAEPLLLRTLAIRDQAPDALPRGGAISFDNLARRCHAQGARAKLEPLYQRTLNTDDKVPGATPPDASAGSASLPGTPLAQGVEVSLSIGQTVAAVIDGYMFDTGRSRPDLPSPSVTESRSQPSPPANAPPTTEQYSSPALPGAGRHLWLRADTGITASRRHVSQWLDQSGNGRDASMSTPARQPLYIPDALNGHPVLRFAGAQSMNLDNVIRLTSFSIFVVGKNNKASESFSMILGPAGSSPNNQLRWEDGSHALFVGTGNNLPIVTSAIGNTRVYHVLSTTYDQATMSVYRDGNRTSSRRFMTGDPWILASVGSYYSKEFMEGDVAEILVYDRALSESERQSVNAYLRTRYRLP